MLGYREALELFRYDYETGVLYWRRRVPKTLEAGTQRRPNSDGYLNVSVNGRLYPVHRVVMLMCYGFYGEGLEVEADRKYKFNNNHGEGRAEYVRKKADARLSK